MNASTERDVREIDLLTVATRDQAVELRIGLRRLQNDARITDETAALVEHLADQLGDELEGWPAADPNAAGGPGDTLDDAARRDSPTAR